MSVFVPPEPDPAAEIFSGRARKLERAWDLKAESTDAMGGRFPRPWHIAVFLFGLSFGGYAASMSWTAFPGEPSRLLLQHLRMGEVPAVVHLLWGWGVRAAGRLPRGGLSLAGWMGLFSALCGAASVALLGLLMDRIPYVVPAESGPNSALREAQARRLAALVAGLYLACSIPFWVVSTRSLPGAFHMLLLLASVWWYVEFERSGLMRYLALMGLTYGLGVTESVVFIFIFPPAVYWALRGMFNWQVMGRWRSQFLLWGGFLAGLSIYAPNAFFLFQRGKGTQSFASPMDALWQIWKEQALAIADVRYSPGFLVVVLMTLIPWMGVFILSRRSPWFYERGQIGVRLFFLAGLLAVLANAPFAPWAILGMSHLLITPYLLLAACMGYMAGEFWILGESNPLSDFRPRQRAARRLASSFALLLPLGVLAAGLPNVRIVDGRQSRVFTEYAEDILRQIDGSGILFSRGWLDEILRLAIRERRDSALVISGPRVGSATYLRGLARYFSLESMSLPLARGNFDDFFENLMMSEQGMSMSVAIDLPDLLREYGYVIPDGWFYRLQAEKPTPDLLLRLLERPGGPWRQVEAWRKNQISEHSPARPYQDYLGRLAARMANALGYNLMEAGEFKAALEAFQHARNADPENLSAQLNYLAAASRLGQSDLESIEAELLEKQSSAESRRWNLARQDGYVWEPRQWLSRGWVWAMSGMPPVEEGHRHRSAPRKEPEADELLQRIAKIYLQWNEPPVNLQGLYEKLRKTPWDPAPLVELGQQAILQGDAEAARAYLAAAVEVGVSEASLQLHQAMLDLLESNPESALVRLEQLTHLAPGDSRVWVGLMLLTEEEDSRNRHAIWTLRNHHSGNPKIHLILASLFMKRGHWNNAHAELERSLGIQPNQPKAWELMLMLGQETGNRALISTSRRALMLQDPSHFIQFQNEGVAHYEEGNLEQAEMAFREGIRRRRDPAMLNNLAHVINRRGGDLQEAMTLVNEALRRQPGGSPSMLNTRGEIWISMGRLPEARRDIFDAIRGNGRNMDPLLELTDAYYRAGDLKHFAAMVRVGEALRDRLHAVQRQRLDEFHARLAAAHAPP